MTDSNTPNPSESTASIYYTLFSVTDEAMAIHRVVRDDNGNMIDLEVVDVNSAWERIMRGHRDEVIGHRLSTFNLMQPVLGDTLLQLYGRVVHNGQPITTQLVNPHNEKYYGISIALLDNEHVTAMFHEITHTKVSELTYRSIFDSMSDAVFVYDAETGLIVDLNRRAEEATGLPRHALIGTSLVANEPAEISAAIVQIREELNTCEKAQRLVTFQTRQGRLYWLNFRARKAEVSGHKRIVILMQDVTEAQIKIKALIESEGRYRAISELVSNYTYSIITYPTGEAALEWVTDAFTALTGYTQEEAAAEIKRAARAWYLGMVHPDDHEKTSKAINQLLAEGSVEYEYRLIRKDGGVIWVRTYVKYTPLEDGSGKRFIGVVKDISDRIQAENTYLSIYNSVNDSIFVHDINSGKIVDLNIRAAMMMGYPRDEIIGRLRLPHETVQRGKMRGEMIQRAARGEIFEDESVYTGPDGSTSWIESRFKVGWVAGKKRVLVVSRDITERKQASEALERSQERYRTISDMISDFAFQVDVRDNDQWKIEWITDAYTRLTGYSLEETNELLKVEHGDFLYNHLAHPDDQWIVRRDFVQFRADRSVMSIFRMVRKDHSIFWVRAYFKAIISGNQIVGVTGGVKDITDQVSAERNYRAVFEAVNDAILVLDASDGSVLDANRLGDAMLIAGWSGSPENRVPDGLFSNISHEEYLEIVHAAAAGEDQERDWQSTDASGRTKWVNVRMTAANLSGEKRILAVFRDVTESRQAIEAIRESEERYRSVSDGIPDWAFLMDVNDSGLGRLIWTSASVERMTGRTETEVRAGCAREGYTYFNSLIHPDDRGIFQNGYQRLQHQDTVEAEFRFLKPSGEIVWTHAYLRGMRRTDGKITGMIAVIQDITAQKHAESTYLSIFESVNDGIFVLDPISDEVVDANLPGCRMLGYERDAVIGKQPPFGLDHPASAACWQDLMHSLSHAQESETDWQIVDTYGATSKWINLRMKRVLIGSEERVLVVFRDISGRKEGIETLRQTEMRHLKIGSLITTFGYIFRYDPARAQWQFDWVGRTVEEVTGYTKDEIQHALVENTPMILSRFIYPDDVPGAQRDLEALNSSSHRCVSEYRVITKDQRVIWISATIQIEYAVDGSHPTYLYGCVQDITARKQYELTLLRQLDQNASLSAMSLTLSTSLDTRIVLDTLINEAFTLLKADALELALYNSTTQTLTSAGGRGFRLTSSELPSAGDTAQQAARERRVLAVSNVPQEPALANREALLSEGFLSLCAIPLTLQNRVIGVMTVYRRSVTEFTGEWADLAAAVALRGAIAIHHAQQFEKLE